MVQDAILRRLQTLAESTQRLSENFKKENLSSQRVITRLGKIQ